MSTRVNFISFLLFFLHKIDFKFKFINVVFFSHLVNIDLLESDAMKRSIYVCLNHVHMVFVLIVSLGMNVFVILDGRVEIVTSI